MIIPDWNDYHPALHADLACGAVAVDAITHNGPVDEVAIDTETPSISDPFTIKCVTAAWYTGLSRVQAVILDPLRTPGHRQALAQLMSRARKITMHNASFDVVGLYATGLMDLDHIALVADTLVYARMAYPDTLERKDLGALAARLLGMDENAHGMTTAFAAAGYKSKAAGFAGMDISSAAYRYGAMADTVATLRLRPMLHAAAIRRQLDHPFETYGLTITAEAQTLVESQQRVNRVMLRRSARGLGVDLDYLDTYRSQVETGMLRAEAVLICANVRPGNGNDLMAAIDRAGDLPSNWPRTPTGRLRADKANLEKLDHPLAQAHRAVAHGNKVLGYLEKVVARSRHSGRLHPQVNVLGASATGRMAYAEPELQQFPAEARPIIVFDDPGGASSLDWAQIEPVVLANMARDTEFLAPFEAGGDLYEPIQRAAGIIRTTAKVVLLAQMYGQMETSLARTLGTSIEAASQIKRQVLAAMPESAKFMRRIQAAAANHGLVPTLSGRILTVPSYQGKVMDYKAVNYLVQGSAYDVLAESILAAEDAGLGDAIHLAMHDELVVDTAAAAEIENIMRTPPRRLIAWARRVPILRTDRADLGHTWQAT